MPPRRMLRVKTSTENAGYRALRRAKPHSGPQVDDENKPKHRKMEGKTVLPIENAFEPDKKQGEGGSGLVACARPLSRRRLREISKAENLLAPRPPESALREAALFENDVKPDEFPEE